MSILSGVSDFFGLDVSGTAVRAVQLKGSGPVKALDRYGEAAVAGMAAMSDAKVDRQNVAKTIHELIKKVGINTKNVAVNVPSNRVFTTIIDMDRLPAEELAKTIRYQAESFIPTPIEQAKIDWAVIGVSPKDQQKVEVLLSSVPNDFIEARLDLLESIGLNVIAFEPDGLALARSIVPYDATTTQIIIDVGNNYTDLVITMAGVPHLSRAIPTGLQAIVRSAVTSLSVEPEQAEQFVTKFGLSKDKLEGQVYNAILGTVESIMVEVEKSIKFFQSRYPNVGIERVVVTGGASSLPEFPLFIANRFGLNVEIGNAWRNVSFSPSQQNELLAISNHFGVAAGLAERDA